MQIAALIFAGLLLLFCTYYAALAVYGLLLRGKQRGRGITEKRRATRKFAILIPAHNEEATLPVVLDSCAELDYQGSLFDVFVIADNCTDETAKVASGYDVNVLVRNNVVERGKGYALQWALERVLPQGHDAIVVLDADCTIQSHALLAYDRYLKGGAAVLQSKYLVSNPDETAMSYVSAVGSVIRNELFYWPKSELGLAVLLLGTGMVFTRAVLEEHPWTAHSIVEDAEYAVRLLRHRLRVVFLNDVVVASEFPATWKQLRVQRLRWASGNVALAKRDAVRLVWQGVCMRDKSLADAGVTFLTLSKPLVLVTFLFAALTSGWVSVFGAQGGLEWLFGSVMALGGVLIGYFLLGAALLGMSWRRLALLVKAPMVVARLNYIAVLGLAGVDKELWTRTPRS